MLRQDRNPGGSLGIAKSLLLGAVVLAGCSGAPATTKSESLAPIDPVALLRFSRTLEEYVQALLLLDSRNPSDWKRARTRLEALRFHYFREDPMLLQELLSGGPEKAEAARIELARRGKILDGVRVFGRPQTKALWNKTRKDLLALGEDAGAFLVDSLLQMLLNGAYRHSWPHLRYQLVECGRIGAETTAALARRIADGTPDTPIWKQDDLVQLIMALIGFGGTGVGTLQDLAAHKTPNVRKATATALGESLAAEHVGILTRFLEKDADWQVRAAAADALGPMRPARAKIGPALLAHLPRERDNFVLHKVIRAIGRVDYLEAIPQLIGLLHVPNYDTVQVAMEALYDLTGQRLTSAPAWQRWYRTSYPLWIREKREGRSP